MNASTVTTLAVPGAWMGSWIWEPTVARLRERGFAARTMTLPGLAAGLPDAEIAEVRLADHVDALVAIVTASEKPVVLVGHSYSSMVTAQAADRLGDAVAGLVHIGGCLPADGLSLLDGWGDSRATREQERADIQRDGNLWAAPPRAMLDEEPDLTPDARDHLAASFTAHPGSTVTDAAVLSRPVTDQRSTYVALPAAGAEDAWQELPAAAHGAVNWRTRSIVGGHWPMLAQPEPTTDLLAEEIAHYAGRIDAE
ncbi:alpha/beta fold hydrolase [Rhodococcus rhodnii]|nr:alpha/beta hydrolase [Rhodococcus rhodnii]